MLQNLLRYKALRCLAILIAILLLAPYPLTLFYRAVPPISTFMLADALTLNFPTRHWVPLNRISPHLVIAVLSSEDAAFCDHHGVDFNQMQKSVTQAIDRAAPIRATSTLTMQTAKNLFLWNGRSWLRKALEFPLTFWIELTWPKRRILEVYLNIAEWGDGIYGAEAAARHYFNTSAASLSPRQAALLATALPSPLKRAASRPAPGHRLLAANLEARILRAGVDTSCLR